MESPLESLRQEFLKIKFLIHTPQFPAVAEGYEACLAELNVLQMRLQAGHEAPLVVSLLGGTGVGKSTLFNTIIGEPLCATSVLRPCTAKPFVYCHERHADFVREALFLTNPTSPEDGSRSSPPLLYEVACHSRPEFEHLVLIDSPDFDSIELANRTMAIHLCQRSDIVILVTSPARYADEAQWYFLRKAKAESRIYWIILNQFCDQEVYRDFSDKLHAEGLMSTILAFCIDRSSMQNGLLTKEKQQIDELKQRLFGILSVSSRQDLQQHEVRINTQRLQLAVMDLLIPHISREAAQLVASSHKLKELTDRNQEKFLASLKHVVGEETKARIAELFRQNLRKYADPFRPIRQTLLSPFMALGTFAWSRWQRSQGDNSPAKHTSVIDSHHAFNKELLWSQVQVLQHQWRDYLKTIPFRDPAAIQQRFTVVNLTQEQCRHGYERGKDELTAWLRQQFEGMTHDISKKKSIQLTVIQTLWIGLIIGMEFGSGGGFMLFEGLADMFIFPFLGPILVKAFSWDHYKELAQEAGAKHQELSKSIIAAQRRQYDEVIAELNELTGNPKELERLLQICRDHITQLSWHL